MAEDKVLTNLTQVSFLQFRKYTLFTDTLLIKRPLSRLLSFLLLGVSIFICILVIMYLSTDEIKVKIEMIKHITLLVVQVFAVVLITYQIFRFSRYTLFANRISIALIAISIPFFITDFFTNPLNWVLMIMIFLMIIFITIFPYLTMKKNFQRFGETLVYNLKFEEKSFKVKTTIGERSSKEDYPYNKIYYAYEVDELIFVFLSEKSAIIIDRNNFSGQDYDQFLNYLGRNGRYVKQIKW